MNAFHAWAVGDGLFWASMIVSIALVIYQLFFKHTAVLACAVLTTFFIAVVLVLCLFFPHYPSAWMWPIVFAIVAGFGAADRTESTKAFFQKKK